ncbi:hypothetical protein BpHYR1_004938 [Brachionus plicatilis]|uniref:SWIM-type domain-containing protein n=1 Tax=Brachionus plicatilis TaxID=10195 RepID=A0A3M7S1B9_BRAPC|nr:hypothetical protein BpHYR1_004938 [Brachionus plicatilis]
MESEMPENCDETIDNTNDSSNLEFGKKRRGKGAVYDFCTAITYSDFLKNFNVKLNNKGLVQMFECQKNIFKYRFKRNLKEGTKFYYQCSPWKETCLVSSYITIKNDHVSIFIEDEPHDHSTKNERGISEETKKAINKLYDVGVRAPKAILRSLDKQGFNCPMKSQLQNYLVRLRKDRMSLKNDDISKDCNQGSLDVFKKDFYVDLPLYTASYQWISTIKTENIIKMRHDNKIYHLTSMTMEKALAREKVIEYGTISGDLLEKNLIENCHLPKITKTYLDKSNWQNSKCNCRYFLENYICVHIIGLAFKYRLVDIPESARCMEAEIQVERLEKTKASFFFDKSSSSADDSDSEVLSNGSIKEIESISNGDLILENINRFKRSISAMESNDHELENPRKRGRPKKKI